MTQPASGTPLNEVTATSPLLDPADVSAGADVPPASGVAGAAAELAGGFNAADVSPAAARTTAILSAAGPAPALVGADGFLELVWRSVVERWSVNLNALLHFVADMGWLRLSGSFGCFFLTGGGAPEAVSHPQGEPLLEVICEPPRVFVSSEGTGRRVLSVNLPEHVAKAELLTVLAHRFGDPTSTRLGYGWRYQWDVDDRVLTFTEIGGRVVLSVADDHAVTDEIVNEDFVLQRLNTLIEDLTAVEIAEHASFVRQLAKKYRWVKTDGRGRDTEYYASPIGPWGVPGVVVHYRDGMVQQVFVQGMPYRHTLAGRQQLSQIRDSLLEAFAGKYGPYNQRGALREGPRGLMSPSKRAAKGYWFYALNRKSIVTILDDEDALPISVTYALSELSEYWGAAQENWYLELAERDAAQGGTWFREFQRQLKPLPGPTSLTYGGKHFLALAGVLLLAVIVRIFW
ncbi:hypothetical protein ABYF32_04440 [Buchananella felis]|uniref:hypothetical protein n=1 Tax=Buchananella felis TaxID=3231492 RepID=UPI0035284991